ncbi:hypothetical protein [Rhodococcus sp. NPDC058521]|uniref:hypothetical protein n=1 Tax=Rhodococcus sp. NPDC058521 TaxID=3346536 RepID=UPI0036584006
MTSPSATLTAWAGAWLHGLSAPDDVVDAMQEWAPMHLVCAENAVTAGRTGLPWPDPQDSGAATLLGTLRREATVESELRLVLPEPGDVRGLPADTAFAKGAISSGQGVLIGRPGHAGTGLVPTVEGPDVLRWTAYTIDETPIDADQIPLGEAEYLMREATREAASAISGLHTVGADTATHPREVIAEALAHTGRHRYPDSTPARVLRVLDSADRVDAILSAAVRLSPADPLTAASGTLAELLRPLGRSVRLARAAAINSTTRAARTS